jgi:L-iditol 2-dehydrogenase
MANMRAWVVTGKEQMEMVTRPIPRPGDEEVLVRVNTMGICGSDVHFYKDGCIGSFVTDGPLVVGHEGAGDIAEVGANVTEFQPGDRVIIEPGKPCFSCPTCRSGRYHFCPSMQFMGTPPTDGCHAEYVAWPKTLVHKMPDTMPYTEGAIVEPFVVGLQGLQVSGVGFGDSAVVLGVGPIGLLMIQALRTAGSCPIIAVGRTAWKLDLAKKMGATHIVDTTIEKDPVSCVRNLTDGLGAQYGFEAVGSDETYRQIMDFTRDGGAITLIGLIAKDGTPMPMATGVMRGLSFVPVMRYSNLFPKAISLLTYGYSKILPSITHEFSFEDSAKAFYKAVHDKKDAAKMVIHLTK